MLMFRSHYVGLVCVSFRQSVTSLKMTPDPTIFFRLSDNIQRYLLLQDWTYVDIFQIGLFES